MMRQGTTSVVVWALVLGGLTAWAGGASAQQGPDDGFGGGGGGAAGQITTGLPRDNVRGGAVAARRPGSWIGAALARHLERHQTTLGLLGGAQYASEDLAPSPKKVFLLDTLEQIFFRLNLFISALVGGLAGDLDDGALDGEGDAGDGTDDVDDTGDDDTSDGEGDGDAGDGVTDAARERGAIFRYG